MKKYLFPIDALVVWCPTWSKNLGRTTWYVFSMHEWPWYWKTSNQKFPCGGVWTRDLAYNICSGLTQRKKIIFKGEFYVHRPVFSRILLQFLLYESAGASSQIITARKYDAGSKDASLLELPRIFIGSFPGSFHIFPGKVQEKLTCISEWPCWCIAVKLMWLQLIE